MISVNNDNKPPFKCTDADGVEYRPDVKGPKQNKCETKYEEVRVVSPFTEFSYSVHTPTCPPAQVKKCPEGYVLDTSSLPPDDGSTATTEP